VSSTAPGPRRGAFTVAWVAIQLCALSFQVPLAVISGSQRALVGIGSALEVGLLVFISSLLVYFELWRVSRSVWKALAWTSVAIVFFWHWTPADPGQLPWLLSMVAFALALVAAGRYAETRYLKVGFFAVSVTISSTFLLLFAIEEFNTPAPVVVLTGAPEVASLVHKPDIVFLVLDAYAREDVLSSAFGFDNSGFLDELESQGFEVYDSANANYGGTHLSLPSVLNMSYVAQGDDVITNSDLDALAETISGNNSVVRSLKAEGYSYTHSDTDHWLNSCGNEVDHCLPGPFLDVTADALLGGTPVGPLLYPTSGDPTTALNIMRIDDLMSWPEIRASFGPLPNFAFVHLILPHPPLFLTSDCSLDVDPDMAVRTLTDDLVDEAQLTERRSAFVEQTKCANATVLRFLEDLDRETAIVITADHGPDSYGSMSGHLDQWSSEQIWERMATFSAIRLPSECSTPVDEDLQLVNTFRIVLSCLSGEDVPLLDSQFFGATYGGPIFQLKNPDSDVD